MTKGFILGDGVLVITVSQQEMVMSFRYFNGERYDKTILKDELKGVRLSNDLKQVVMLKQVAHVTFDLGCTKATRRNAYEIINFLKTKCR